MVQLVSKLFQYLGRCTNIQVEIYLPSFVDCVINWLWYGSKIVNCCTKKRWGSLLWIPYPEFWERNRAVKNKIDIFQFYSKLKNNSSRLPFDRPPERCNPHEKIHFHANELFIATRKRKSNKFSPTGGQFFDSRSTSHPRAKKNQSLFLARSSVLRYSLGGPSFGPWKRSQDEKRFFIRQIIILTFKNPKSVY